MDLRFIGIRAGGEEVSIRTVTADDGWSWIFEDLPKYSEGKEIVYTITEDTVDDYTTSVEGFDVINTYAPGRTQVTVTKLWDDRDDADGIRPEYVTVKLLANGLDTARTLVLSEEGNWSGTFRDLDTRKDGADIVYTVEEVTDSVITGTDGEGTYAYAVTGTRRRASPSSTPIRPSCSPSPMSSTEAATAEAPMT